MINYSLGGRPRQAVAGWRARPWLHRDMKWLTNWLTCADRAGKAWHRHTMVLDKALYGWECCCFAVAINTWLYFGLRFRNMEKQRCAWELLVCSASSCFRATDAPISLLIGLIIQKITIVRVMSNEKVPNENGLFASMTCYTHLQSS